MEPLFAGVSGDQPTGGISVLRHRGPGIRQLPDGGRHFRRSHRDWRSHSRQIHRKRWRQVRLSDKTHS